jgi:cellulose synthase operon protein C
MRPVAVPLLNTLWIMVVAASLSACDSWVGVDTRVERARTYLDKGRYRPALAELKTALQNEPGHVQARILLAEASLSLGDLAGADKELDRAASAGASIQQVSNLRYEVLLAQARFDDVQSLLEKDSTTPAVRRLVLQARVERGKGAAAAAEATLQRALKEAPEDPDALLELARVMAGRGEPRAALDLPARIDPSDRAYARAQLLRGGVLMARGDHGQAREALESAQKVGGYLRAPEQLAIAASLTEANLALNDPAAAEKSLAGVVSWAPTSVITHYLRARIAMLKNDPTAAVAESQRALRIDPGHVQSQLLLAAAHLSKGTVEQAEGVLTSLVASHPENPAARKLLAQVYLGRNQPLEAQRVLSAAGSSGFEGDSETDWLMGAALLRSGSNASGVQYLERSAAARPEDVRRRIDLAGAYIAARTPDKAVDLLKSVPPDSSFASQAKVLLVLATAVGKTPAQARREVEDLAAAHDDDARLASAAGAYLASVGDLERGRALLKRAVQLDPKSADTHMTLARIEATTRNVSEAERQLLEVVKLDPQHQMARVALAELAWTSGDRAQSRKWLEEAISVDPSAVEARMRLAQIAFVDTDGARARNLLAQAVDVARDRKGALSAAGKVLAQAGHADEAFAKFRDASAAGDRDATLHAARLHMDLDQMERARQLLEAAVTDQPEWRDPQRLLVMIDAREGHVDKAVARARSLLIDASPSALRALEGDLYALAGQSSAAIAAYEDAQRQLPSAALAVRIFNVRAASGDKSAERSLSEWLVRSPDDADVRRLLAAYYESTGRGQLAVGEYERLLSAGRIDPQMLNNLAWWLHEKGDPRALELARQAYGAAPHLAEISDTYGWILVQMDKVAEGLPVLERGLEKAPTNPEIQYHAALAYAKSGQAARALELLRKSLQTTETFPSREAAQQLLQSIGAAKT